MQTLIGESRTDLLGWLAETSVALEEEGVKGPILKYRDGLVKVCGRTDGNHRRPAGNDGSVGMSASVLTEERWKGSVSLRFLFRDMA